jgi:hypothetical protein
MLDARLEPILDNGRYFEAPRWHDGRLWLVDAGARTLLRLARDGSAELVCIVEEVYRPGSVSCRTATRS